MSSIESIISEIEEDYNRILNSFKTHLTHGSVYGFKETSEEKLLKLLRSVMNFQRKLEYFVESTTRVAKKTECLERLEKISTKLLEKLAANKKISSVKFSAGTYASSSERDIIGVIPELRDAHNELLHGYDASTRRSCYCAYFGFKSIQTDLIELEEELRLIGALTTYPIGKKIRLKNQLVINDFEEAAVSLEEAGSNVEAEHFKDCLSRCRDAVEIFVASIREKETGEKTERHFATDLGKTVKIGIFDVATQRLAQGVYSFLSVKGSHKYDAKRVSVYDAETSLKETYSLLEMLLKRYLDLRKSRKTPK